MIIAFLKYYSVQKAQKIQEAQKPKEQPTKQVTERRVVEDVGLQNGVLIPEAHISESLG